MELEICATSLTSVRNAAQSGASRVELCSGYALGGLTPSWGLLQSSVALKTIPIHCLIRPREGNFCYAPDEVATMCEDIRMAREVGAAGVVVGALTPEGALDLPALEAMMVEAVGLELSFHRAFDAVQHPEEVIQQLAAMGFRRILSAGAAPSAYEGLAKLKAWETASPKGLAFQPGGGVNTTNCKAFQEAGFKHLHCSAFTPTIPLDTIDPNDPFALPPGGHSDFETIKKMVSILKIPT